MQLTTHEQDAVKHFVRGLKQRLGGRLDRVLLFGSRARGDARADSDIDLLVLVRGLDRELESTVFDVLLDVQLESDADISIVLFDTSQFESYRQAGSQFALNVIREGILVT